MNFENQFQAKSEAESELAADTRRAIIDLKDLQIYKNLSVGNVEVQVGFIKKKIEELNESNDDSADELTKMLSDNFPFAV